MSKSHGVVYLKVETLQSLIWLSIQLFIDIVSDLVPELKNFLLQGHMIKYLSDIKLTN
jgi:hypothetical protein